MRFLKDEPTSLKVTTHAIDRFCKRVVGPRLSRKMQRGEVEKFISHEVEKGEFFTRLNQDYTVTLVRNHRGEDRCYVKTRNKKGVVIVTSMPLSLMRRQLRRRRRNCKNRFYHSKDPALRKLARMGFPEAWRKINGL